MMKSFTCLSITLLATYVVAQDDVTRALSKDVEFLTGYIQKLGATVADLQDKVGRYETTVQELNSRLEQQEAEIERLKSTSRSPPIADDNNIQAAGSDTEPVAEPGIEPPEPSVGRGIRSASPLVAFSVYMDKSFTNLADNATLLFNQILLNRGSGYDAQSGTFTAPTSGVYVFSFFITAYTSDGTKSEMIAKLVIGGRHEVDAIAEVNAPGMNDQGGNMVIVELDGGETVWVANHRSGDAIINTDTFRFSTFSGYAL